MAARDREQKRGLQSGTIAALDVGTSKICCLIARHESFDGRASLRALGVGYQLATGFKAGAVTDMAAAEESITAAVEAAEEAAGVTVRQVILGLPVPGMMCRHVRETQTIGGRELSDGDYRRILGQMRARQITSEHLIVHALPVNFTIDGNRGVKDPRGMWVDTLESHLHFVSLPKIRVRNLIGCVRRLHLDIQDLVAAPYASGLASLVDEEMDLGATCIEMGAGLTSIAQFAEGRLVGLEAIPVGGGHVTGDLAKGLATPLREAERIKTLYGSVLAGGEDEDALITLSQMGEDEDEDQGTQVPRSHLMDIIRPRMEETFELVKAKLEASAFDKAAGQRIVLTGGASQLTGTREMAADILGRQVRLGRPLGAALGLEDLADTYTGPAFAVAAGLAGTVLRAPEEASAEREGRKGKGAGFFQRFLKTGS